MPLCFTTDQNDKRPNIETEIVSKSQQQTEKLGFLLARFLKRGDVVSLTGDLGSGKTALIRGILRALGVTSPIVSPSFSIVNEYRILDLKAAHFDLYRIESETDLYSTGFFDYLGDALLLVEWGECADQFFPEDCIRIALSGSGEQPRRIVIRADRPLTDLTDAWRETEDL